MDDAHDCRAGTDNAPEIDRRPERAEILGAARPDREAQPDPAPRESDRDAPAPRSEPHGHRDTGDHGDTPLRDDARGPSAAQRPGGAQRHAPAAADPGAAPGRKRLPPVGSPRQAAILSGAVESTAPGELDAETIERYVSYHRTQIRYCYEKKLMAVPALAGTVSVRFFITPRGTVASLTAAGLDDVASCVAAAIRDIVFPTSAAGVWVKYPYHFMPLDDR